MPHGGRRFCLHFAPAGAPRAALVHVPAFAEEMNKSRAMVASTARALAEAGYAVMLIDLLGCGDSDGDHADARWPAWLSDVAWAASWLRGRHDAPLWLWGHRAGALLACASLPAIERPCNLLVWNPVLKGKAIAQQFVRLKAAAAWASSDAKGAAEWVRAQRAAGEVVEIAGYGLHPSLLDALDATAFDPPTPPPATAAQLLWLEAAGRDGEPALSPAAETQCSRWIAAGWHARTTAVEGPAFWQTVEIERAPALTQATVAALLALQP